MQIEIRIYQGKQNIQDADVNVVIDVIRAFTVSHYAFMSGTEYIALIGSIQEGLTYKKNTPHCILSGEVKAYKIETFDCGNSPYEMQTLDLSGKILGQKTTNGVSVTLHSLNAKHIYVTGFSNYHATVQQIKSLIKKHHNSIFRINLIASHPTGDEDLACAELMCGILKGKISNIKNAEEATVSRILKCEAAQKFLDVSNNNFSILDIALCINPQRSDFVMEVEPNKENIPIIVKRELSC